MAKRYEVKADNTNYAAKVVRVNAINHFDNCDNVVGTPVMGFQAIVGKDTQVGDLVVVFPAEVQLSEGFVKAQGLSREDGGYIEKNRRVKALRFRGHQSDALALPLESVDATLPEGAEFDHLNGVEVCRKYVVPVKEGTPRNVNRIRRSRVDGKMFPEHFDTAQFWRNQDEFKPQDYVSVTQKLHGSSVRLGRTWVNKPKKWWHRVLGIKPGQEIALLAGSRRVIKDPDNTEHKHFYGEENDIWNQALEQYGSGIPENVVVYGELIGWVNETTPIQPNYTYDVPRGEFRLVVYRVTFIGHDGGQYDLSWEGVKQFCRDRGWAHVPELWSGPYWAFEPEEWTDEVYVESFANALPLSDPKTVDEGVCIRREGITPTVLKLKSPVFLNHESKVLDEGVGDLE